MNDYPQMKALLWDKIRNYHFEEQFAKQNLALDEALQQLDYTAYFDIKGEPMNGALREKILAYPVIAIREAIANALIHQDFSITGTGVVVEIFNNRIEITDSGIPLVDIYRIVDNPPKSRNEKLASLMRRLRMCEELGTGWDKIIISCVLYIQGEFLTNSSLRIRFGLEEKSSASISRLIKEACERNLIKKLEETAPRHTKYISIWA